MKAQATPLKRAALRCNHTIVTERSGRRAWLAKSTFKSGRLWPWQPEASYESCAEPAVALQLHDRCVYSVLQDHPLTSA